MKSLGKFFTTGRRHSAVEFPDGTTVNTVKTTGLRRWSNWSRAVRPNSISAFPPSPPSPPPVPAKLKANNEQSITTEHDLKLMGLVGQQVSVLCDMIDQLSEVVLYESFSTSVILEQGMFISSSVVRILDYLCKFKLNKRMNTLNFPLWEKCEKSYRSLSQKKSTLADFAHKFVELVTQLEATDSPEQAYHLITDAAELAATSIKPLAKDIEALLEETVKAKSILILTCFDEAPPETLKRLGRSGSLKQSSITVALGASVYSQSDSSAPALDSENTIAHVELEEKKADGDDYDESVDELPIEFSFPSPPLNTADIKSPQISIFEFENIGSPVIGSNRRISLIETPSRPLKDLPEEDEEGQTTQSRVEPDSSNRSSLQTLSNSSMEKPASENDSVKETDETLPQSDHDELLNDEDDDIIDTEAEEALLVKVAHSRKTSKFFGAEEIVIQNNLKTLINKPKEWYLNYDYDKEDCTFDMEGQVSGATVDALIERLTLHDHEPDENFVMAFWLCFRCFVRPGELVEKLQKRFFLEPPEGLKPEDLTKWTEQKLHPVQRRVAEAYKAWLGRYWITEKDIDTIEDIQDFVQDHISSAVEDVGLVLQVLVEQRMDIDAEDPTGPRLGVKEKSGAREKLLGRSHAQQAHVSFRIPTSVLDITPVDLANQLTLMDSRLFMAICPRELVGQEFSRKIGSLSVNVRAMSALATHITTWVAETILAESTDIKRRAMFLKYFIKLGDKCKQLNNYDCMFAIMSALTNSAISRLKKTWRLLLPKTMETFGQLQEICSVDRNRAEYRKLLKQVNPPCLPFLGMYLTDLTFIDDGNADLKKNSAKPMVNFGKYLKTVILLNEITKFQSVSYHLEENSNLEMIIKRWIDHVDVKGDIEQRLYEKSLVVEPRT